MEFNMGTTHLTYYIYYFDDIFTFINRYPNNTSILLYFKFLYDLWYRQRGTCEKFPIDNDNYDDTVVAIRGSFQDNINQYSLWTYN